MEGQREVDTLLAAKLLVILFPFLFFLAKTLFVLNAPE